jgi:hypothetical protein
MKSPVATILALTVLLTINGITMVASESLTGSSNNGNTPQASIYESCSDPASGCSCPSSMMLIIPPLAGTDDRTIPYCQSVCFPFWNTCVPSGGNTLPACFGNLKLYRPQCSIATAIYEKTCQGCLPGSLFAMYQGEQFCFTENSGFTPNTPCNLGSHNSCLAISKTEDDSCGPIDSAQLAKLFGSKCPDAVGCAARAFPSNGPSDAVINETPVNPFDFPVPVPNAGIQKYHPSGSTADDTRAQS